MLITLRLGTVEVMVADSFTIDSNFYQAQATHGAEGDGDTEVFGAISFYGSRY